MTCMCDFPSSCGGTGHLECDGCGGDICVCLCGGDLGECPGCEDCADIDPYDGCAEATK